MTRKGVTPTTIFRTSLLATMLAAVAFCVIGVTAAPASARAGFYVDRNDRACSDAGPGTRANPFCTINAGTSRAVASQKIHVAPGTYSGRVTFGHSGTANRPISLVAAPGVTLTSSSTGIDISGRNWITIRGIAVTGTTDYGIDVSSGSHITIKNVHVSNSGSPIGGKTRSGIHFDGTYSLITRVVSDHNSDAGIFLGNAATGVVVRHSTTYANARGYVRAAPGIDVRGAGNIITGNIVHDNEDSGIQIYNGADANLVIENVVYDNGDHGIDVLNSTNAVIVSNTVFRNMTSGINVEGSSRAATLANNVSVDNALANTFGEKGNIRVDHTSVPGTTLDYDELFLRSPGTMVRWNGTAYDSIAAFTAATGEEANGLQADPLWIDPTSGDFRLSPGSPAIDSANSGVPAQPSRDIRGLLRVDDPATPNTGAGPRDFDDRGAYEYQPP